MSRSNITNGARKRIRELESELALARKLGRIKREPITGFGGAVQREREAQGLGVRELAKRANINPSAISRLEQDADANPCLKMILSIARGLDVFPERLLSK